MGVTVFFVLSGYLITGLLAKEIATTHTIKLGHFWLRRIRRLFPAIVCVVVATAALCVLFNHALLTKMRPDIIPSLFWFQNWWYVVRDLSYFESVGDPSPLVHFWSLAIEEQFYVVWPLIILGLYKLGANSKFMRRLCLVLSVLSAVLMMALFDPAADPTRVYYGTDTRAYSLLIGAWLAYVWPWQRFSDTRSPRYPTARTVRTLDVAAIVSFAAICFFIIAVNGYSQLMYYGVIFAVSVLTAIIIADAVLPTSRVARVMSWKPLSWIGIRSYGMYLWHYPIILLLRHAMDPSSWLFPVVAVTLTFVVAAVQYRYVEDPIRKGAIGRFWKEKGIEGLRALIVPFSHTTVVAIASAAVLLVAVIGCIAVPDVTMTM